MVDFVTGLLQGFGTSLQQTRESQEKSKLLKAQVRLFEEQLKARERQSLATEQFAEQFAAPAPGGTPPEPGARLMEMFQNPELLRAGIESGQLTPQGLLAIQQQFKEQQQVGIQRKEEEAFIKGLPLEQQAAARAGGVEAFAMAKAPLTLAQQEEIRLQERGLDIQSENARLNRDIQRQQLAISQQGLNIDREKLKISINETAKLSGLTPGVIATNITETTKELGIIDTAKAKLANLKVEVLKIKEAGFLGRVGARIDPNNPLFDNARTAFNGYLGALAKAEGTGALMESDIRFLERGLKDPSGVLSTLFTTERIESQIGASENSLNITRKVILDSRKDILPSEFFKKISKPTEPPQQRETAPAQRETTLAREIPAQLQSEVVRIQLAVKAGELSKEDARRRLSQLGLE